MMPIKIHKLGTVDCDIVEANPVVWKGRLLRFEYIRWKRTDMHYYANYTGRSHFRFVDGLTGEIVSEPFGWDMHLGNAFAWGDRMVVTCVEEWGGHRFFQMESDDLVHWSEPRIILEGNGWEGYNTTICRAGDRFVMAFELGEPKEMVVHIFTMFFAESNDLVTWKMLTPEHSLFKEIYTGGPMLRHFNGMYYFFFLNSKGIINGDACFEQYVARSRNLIDWEMSPRNPVMTYDDDDKKLNGEFTPSLKQRIATSKDVNVSDMDMAFFDGRLRIVYSWGDQHGTEFLATAEADATEQQLCESFFD